jgi:hypothetical protein
MQRGNYKTATEVFRLGGGAGQQYNNQQQTTTQSNNKVDLSDPKSWGPSFWFTLHNGANHYPENPTSHTMEYMKGFIEGIPIMLPCSVCSEHARVYIDRMKIENKLNDAVMSKENLFTFFWSFHNSVNARTGKPEISLDSVKTMYMYNVKKV